jgi:hypothetical protein
MAKPAIKEIIGSAAGVTPAIYKSFCSLPKFFREYPPIPIILDG